MYENKERKIVIDTVEQIFDEVCSTIDLFCFLIEKYGIESRVPRIGEAKVIVDEMYKCFYRVAHEIEDDSVVIIERYRCGINALNSIKKLLTELKGNDDLEVLKFINYFDRIFSSFIEKFREIYKKRFGYEK